MKRNVFYFAVIVMTLLYASCSDNTDPNGGEIGGEGSITFTLPGANTGSITYADPPVASEDENKLDALNIYVFDSDSKLEKIFRTGDIVFGGVGDARTATVDLTGREGGKSFYFLGNADNKSADLDKLNVGVTTKTEFVEAITDRNVEIPKTPLIMSGSTTIANVQTPTNDEKKVTLKRRVARFDVFNDDDETNFEIKDILIANANQRTYLFPEATKSPPKTIETGNLPTVNFDGITGANEGETHSVFYLYPTTLGPDKTQISFEGIFNNESRIYNLNMTDDVEIEPNKRYILRAKKVEINKVEFTLQIENWQLGTEHVVDPETELVKFSDLKLTGGTGIVKDADVYAYNISNLSTDAKIEFDVTSYGSGGTKRTVKYNHGGPKTWTGLQINDPEPKLSYAAYYMQHYVIDIPKPNPKVPLEMVITLNNVANPDQKLVITIYANRYPGTVLYPVLFEGEYWAPVNVGATTREGYFDVADMGLTYQWGRTNYGSAYGVTDDLEMGPVTAAIGNGNGKNKFITNSFSPQDWAYPAVNNLWTTSTLPCPSGWRIPLLADLNRIKTAFDNGKTEWEAPYLKVKGTNADENENEVLYFPAAGYRLYNGDWIGRGKTGAYWSGNSEATSSWLVFNEGTVSPTAAVGRAHGASVRCIKTSKSF